MIRVALLLTFVLFMNSVLDAKSIYVKKGDKIAFLGDSITFYGKKEGGYCQLVLEALKGYGIHKKSINAGISGNKSDQMLARVEKDILDHKPDWMLLSCGVNDVAHEKNGIDLESYKSNITEIVKRAQAKGIKIMLLTSTMIHEDPKGKLNKALKPYNDFLKVLAKKRKCLLADANTDMQERLKLFPKKSTKGRQLTVDGIHLNDLGNIVMAKSVLKAFGFNKKQLFLFERKLTNAKKQKAK